MSTPTDADPGYTQCTVTDPVEPEAEAEDLRWPEVWSECVKDASEQGCTPEWLLYQRACAAQHIATREACAERAHSVAVENADLAWSRGANANVSAQVAAKNAAVSIRDAIKNLRLEDAPCPKP